MFVDGFTYDVNARSAQIFTNGRYRSIEHRAVVSAESARLSVAAFHSPSNHATIGPRLTVTDQQEPEVPMYKTLDHQSFMRLFFSAKLEGKSFLQRMKLDLDTASSST
jgi:isopenicillin N synthase-like dioxygenase